jgi:hypothetical protein
MTIAMALCLSGLNLGLSAGDDGRPQEHSMRTDGQRILGEGRLKCAGDQ